MSVQPTFKHQLGVVFKPENFFKSAASSFPFLSSIATAIGQLEADALEQRVGSLENEQQQLIKLRALERGIRPPEDLGGWSNPVADFAGRTASIAVAFNAADSDRETERFIPVGHACLIGFKLILLAKEVMALSLQVAKMKGGRVVAIAGCAWYEISPQPVEDAMGLQIHQIINRDEEVWSYAKEALKAFFSESLDMAETASAVPYRRNLFQGEAFGFLHAGEAADIIFSPVSFESLQFSSGTVSHFKKPTHSALKVAVSSVLPGRFTLAGSPAFNRKGELLGIVADSESFPSDAGRRAVIRSLLGLKYFSSEDKPVVAKEAK